MLGGYGTGAVMAVPAHDERDFAFAKALRPADRRGRAARTASRTTRSRPPTSTTASPSRSGEFDGLPTRRGQGARSSDELERARRAARGTVTYKLRDWVFSRQRYWGEPIPIYFPVELADPTGDPRKGDAHTIRYDQPIAVDESELPLRLPELDDFKPGRRSRPARSRARSTGASSRRTASWFARETNTMPQWAGSCWYYLRFLDPQNDAEPWAEDAYDAWMPVDLYVGGAEHAVLHLLYARFWHKVLFDLGIVKHPEPFMKLVHQGMILGEDNEKMSKSRGNVVNPDDIVREYGADALRLYEMFMGPLEAVKPWQTSADPGRGPLPRPRSTRSAASPSWTRWTTPRAGCSTRPSRRSPATSRRWPSTRPSAR